MYSKVKTYILLTFFLLLVSFNSELYAQNKLAISKKAPIYLDFSTVHNAGMKGQIMADDSQWLNYTVLIESAEPSVSISVSVASGSVPEGMELYVEASRYKGFSRGRMGSPIGRIRLSNMPRVLIENIGTSYTGSGRNEGHQLTFFFKVTDYSKLEPGVNTVYVQYTINQ